MITSLGVASAATESRTAPSEVVRTFNECSSYFEEKLVDSLEYTATRDVAQAATLRIQDSRRGRLYSSALDAGCGTGLMCPIADRLIVGVDLSPKMAELAAELVVDDSLTPMTKDLMRRLAAELALAYLSCW